MRPNIEGVVGDVGHIQEVLYDALENAWTRFQVNGGREKKYRKEGESSSRYGRIVREIRNLELSRAR